MAGTDGKWRFAVDRGGTFTDVVGLDPEGVFHTRKLLSSSRAYGDPSVEGIRRVLGLGPGERIPPELVSGVRFGTTVATNALLERKGGRVALVVTGGFRDLLEIGSQSRPDIFALCIEKPSNLYSEVIEVPERVGPDGEVEKPLDPEALGETVRDLGARADSVAVVFLHSWKNPRHEIAAGRVLEAEGVERVYLSHRSVNLIKAVTRGQSAVVDAFLAPVMERYIEGIRSEMGGIPVEFMESSGGLVPPERFAGRGAVLSGPAGGVVASAAVAADAGSSAAVGFDMGGTSTDVSRYGGGEFEKVYEQTVGGVEVQGEALYMETVASGGGSILAFDGERMGTGPDSAGADPGPACYGLGGPPAVTDANLVTGRIIPGFFPSAFGPGGDSPLDEDASRKALGDLAARVGEATGKGISPEEAALGFLEIANEKMALAIKGISVARGYDARDHALVCFGGAGGQHACAVAGLLGMKRIVFHPLGGVMSAYGIGLSRPVKRSERTVLEELTPEAHATFEDAFDEMERAVAGDGFDFTRKIDLRPSGADTFLTVPFTGFGETHEAFREAHTRLYGFYPEETPVEAVNLRVEAVERSDFFPPFRGHAGAPGRASGEARPDTTHRVFYRDGWREVPVYRTEDLGAGAVVTGPAVVVEKYSTLVVDPGFSARVDESGVIVVDMAGEVSAALGPKRVDADDGPDPVLLEVFGNLFSAVATEMGHTLGNTAHSVNIKERRDFSCAVFDPEGGLVASAQHIPVHLGAMADTVKAVLEARGGDMRPGDVFVSNNPYRGGSHLPDVTVVEPVCSDDGELRFFVAARGHHADIGGATPGSMPPEAAHIDEEGVMLDSLLAVRGGRFMEGELRKILTGHRYPARNIDERISDLRAQMAACARGASELGRVTDRYGWPGVRNHMAFLQANAAGAVRRALAGLLEGGTRLERDFSDSLDDGTPVRVRVSINAGDDPPRTVRAVFDFTGTGAQHDRDNLNAPLPVTRSALLYVLRLITGADIPLNSGCLDPVELRVPERTLLNPSYPAPVASGNVETSQRVVDVLLGALGVAGASQGTMNNVLFEVEGETPYYETIAGGSGASEGCPGASGVQVHMTNTRITDPEVLEFRHPGVRLDRFALRRGSGGRGRWNGGDGVERAMRFLRPARVSVISERRVAGPRGMAGGGEGAPGENVVERAGGGEERVGHRAFFEARPGDRLVVRTPGGGGYGEEVQD